MPRQAQKRISIPTLSQASERNFKEAMARGYVVGYVPLPGSYFVGLHDFQCLWQFVSTFRRFARLVVRVVPVNVVVPSISRGVSHISRRTRGNREKPVPLEAPVV